MRKHEKENEKRHSAYHLFRGDTGYAVTGKPADGYGLVRPIGRNRAADKEAEIAYQKAENERLQQLVDQLSSQIHD